MKKQSYIYYLFWVLLLIQVFLYNHDLVVTGASASSCYFSGDEFLLLLYLKYLLGYNLNQSPSEPLFVLRRYGLGTGLNPKIP